MNKKIEEFLDYMAELNSEASYPTGFEEAIIGYVERIGSEPLIVLDRGKCIEILMKDMSQDEAEEYFNYNLLYCWVGEGTPVFFSSIGDVCEM